MVPFTWEGLIVFLDKVRLKLNAECRIYNTQRALNGVAAIVSSCQITGLPIPNADVKLRVGGDVALNVMMGEFHVLVPFVLVASELIPYREANAADCRLLTLGKQLHHSLLPKQTPLPPRRRR